MAEALLGVSQSSLLLHPQTRFSARSNSCLTTAAGGAPTLLSRSRRAASFGRSDLLRAHRHQRHPYAAVVSDPKSSSALTFDSVTKETVNIEPDSGGGDGSGFGDRGDSGGGGGGGGGDNNNRNEGEGEGESHEKNKKMGLSMSQKLTLGYAALVGVGGLMGYLKSGSQKSLLAGGISASLLYYVHTQLPTNPVFASSLGLGLSAALLGVMGTRFKRSGKIFPAGVVSLVSLVMTAGYLHGILRSTH
ncbi:TMEM14 family [Parasponia andersonii]|uniref:TMEM14 family n=1 Tax=Parasponia andersonii TaxID=3476 RepID=A0A2P5BKX7_PARAD|nr:TMEM14 family [Parasponia andersonii]